MVFPEFLRWVVILDPQKGGYQGYQKHIFCTSVMKLQRKNSHLSPCLFKVERSGRNNEDAALLFHSLSKALLISTESAYVQQRPKCPDRLEMRRKHGDVIAKNDSKWKFRKTTAVIIFACQSHQAIFQNCRKSERRVCFMCPETEFLHLSHLIRQNTVATQWIPVV